MSELHLVVNGDPIPKARPRFDRRGHAYNKQRKEERGFRWELISQLKGHEIISMGVPVQLRCAFYLPVPKSIRKKDIGVIEHVKKPDLDNLIKLVKDCCNGIVWHDDSQVVKEECEKYYSWEGSPQTIIEVIW